MKLSKFIHSKIGTKTYVLFCSEEDIEKWIVEWYTHEFNWQGKPKLPPQWLADWKQFQQPERSVVEQERCGIDEG